MTEITGTGAAGALKNGPHERHLSFLAVRWDRLKDVSAPNWCSKNQPIEEVVVK